MNKITKQILAALGAATVSIGASFSVSPVAQATGLKTRISTQYGDVFLMYDGVDENGDGTIDANEVFDVSLNWFGELSAWSDDDVKVFEFDTTTRILNIAFLDNRLMDAQFMFDAAATADAYSSVPLSGSDAMEYARFVADEEYNQHPIEIEEMVDQHTEGDLTVEKRTGLTTRISTGIGDVFLMWDGVDENGDGVIDEPRSSRCESELVWGVVGVVG